MTIDQLRTLAHHHHQLAEAYRSGMAAARLAIEQTQRDCLRDMQHEIKQPRTCAHPAARLSKETAARNKIIKEVMESVAKRMLKSRPPTEEDLDF